MFARRVPDTHAIAFNDMQIRRNQLTFYKIFTPDGEIDILGELMRRIQRAAKKIDMPALLAEATFRKNFYTVQALKELTDQEVSLVYQVHEITYQDFVDKYGAVSVIG